jgi:hypothetical protein
LTRWHLVELEDLDWFPRILRDAGTGFLVEAMRVGRQPRHVAPKLRDVVARSNLNAVVDLCSGGGGPAKLFAQDPALAGLKWTFTDLHPPKAAAAIAAQASATGNDVRYFPEPVDATNVPAELKGIRTIFNGFHHFRPEGARAILQAAVDAKAPIFIAEFVERTPLCLFGMLFPPLSALFLIPLIRPFRWQWLVFTYLIPIIPLFILWDGLVSCLRVYSPKELDGLVAQLRNKESFTWETGRLPLPGAPSRSTFLVGMPRGT